MGLSMTKMSTDRVVCVMCVKIPSPHARNTLLLHIIHGESTQVLRTVAGQMEQYLDLPPPAAAERRRNYCW